MLVLLAYFLMLVNGSPTSFFKASRGLRQGDLISPILFILLAKCLGRFVGNMVMKGDFVGLNPSSFALIFSCQQFVDDSIVMGEASIRMLGILKKLWLTMGMLLAKLLIGEKVLCTSLM